MPYPYHTRMAVDRALRPCAGTVRDRDRTALTLRTFKYQSISLYNSIPVHYRGYSQERFKSAVKQWAKIHIV